MAFVKLPSGELQFKFHGLRFQQNPKAPTLFAFVASANELTKFCGVARKSENLLTNYQRALDLDRVKNEVTPFFRIPENCTPTAVVISLQSTGTAKVDFRDVEIDVDGKKAKLPALDPGITVQELVITSKDFDSISDDQVVAAAKAFLDTRLAVDKKAPPEPEDEEEDSDEESEAEEAEDEPVPEEVIEIGKSMLRDLRTRLEDPTTVTAEMIDSFRDTLRPALVIDGQHRLFGAAGVEEDIPLLVCCLVKPDWMEQVFQFTVVNDKASGIPKPFITSLAGMSLTGFELGELQTRLSQAGIRLWEVEVMQRIGYDQKSPFFQKVEFKVSGAGNKGLGYETMKRVGKAWHQPHGAVLYKLMTAIYYGDPKKRAKKTLLENWQKGDWFKYFCLFWDAFKGKFQGTPSWEVHSHLLTAVVLEALQNQFFKVLNGQTGTFWTVAGATTAEREALMTEKIAGVIEEFVGKFDRKLFEREWKMTSLNHKDGKANLSDLFRKVWEDEGIANHPVFTGNKT